jgi:signal transduction histidine kinase
MLHTATVYLEDRVRQRRALLPAGITLSFLVTADAIVIACAAIATLQRTTVDLPVALAAFAITVAPIVSFALFNFKFGPLLLGATWSLATAVLLFATSTPIHADFAPSLLVLMVATVGTLTSPFGGFLAFLSAFSLVLTASGLHRLDDLAAYCGLLAAGWVIGYLLHAQRAQLIEQIRAQAESLSSQAVAEEGHRIAREVRDIVSNDLSATLLGVTGARRALQVDQDVDDALGALEEAERQGRQAVAELRRTTGFLDRRDDILAHASIDPGLDDIGVLVDDFKKTGLAVTLRFDGLSQPVSPAVGVTLYRVVQESLFNIAKHAPESKSTVAIDISAASAQLAVNNEPAHFTADFMQPVQSCGQQGLSRIRKRIELLGGAIEYGPTDDGWSVCAEIPLEDYSGDWCPWWRAS